ncbi:MAG: efflux transporter outer membrane subunit [Rikenellaceae bacterium]
MIKIKNIVVTLALASQLSGCGLYTKFQPATPSDIVDNLYSYVEPSESDASLLSLSWRELFTDSKLQALIEQGLESNTDLNVARLSVEQAEIALRTARLAYLPSLGFEASANTTSVPSSSYTLSVAASWEIDIFGKIRNAKEQQMAALEQSKAYSQAVQTELIATIANSYYSLLLLDKQIEISNNTLEIWQANIRTVEALNKAGRVNKTSVLQARANKVALESSIVALEEQVAQIENTLSVLIGSVAQRIDRSSMGEAQLQCQAAAGVPLQMVANRPDVRIAEYELAQAYYATNTARASLYPSLTLGGSAAYSDGSSVISNPGQVIYSAVASVVQPIFYQNSLRAQVQISEAQQQQALLQFNQAILDAGAEVNTALLAWQSADAQLDYTEQQIALLTEAVGASQLLMQHGSVNYLEVLTAQITLLQAELSYSATQYNQNQSAIDLYRALGGGKE